MRAAARIVASFTDGATRLGTLAGEPPLLPRHTGSRAGPGPGSRTDADPDAGRGPGVGHRAGTAEVHLVGGAAGPLGGDELCLAIEVGPGADLCVRTVAASLALPGRDGGRSRLTIRATVGSGGRLVWLPEPLVAAAGCRHTTVTAIDLDEGAVLVWRDELVLGRYGEPGGDVLLSTAVRRAGRPAYRSDLTVGPDAPDVLGGARVHASLLTTAEIPAASLGPRAAVLALARGGAVVTALGDDLPETRAVTDRHTGTIR